MKATLILVSLCFFIPKAFASGAQSGIRGLAAQQEQEKQLVILTFNEKNQICAEKLIRSIRNEGNWTQDLYAIIPKQYEVSLELGYFLAVMKVSLFRLNPFTSYTGRNSSATYNSFYLFSKPRFRAYSAIIYVDSVGRVRSPLEPLLLALRDSGATLVMEENGEGVMKKGFYESEFQSADTIRNIVPDTQHPGGGHIFLVNTSRLPPPPEMKKMLMAALEDYGDIVRYADQTILNIFFRRDFRTFAPCNPVKVVHPDAPNTERHWSLRHCSRKHLIYYHDRKNCMNS